MLNHPTLDQLTTLKLDGMAPFGDANITCRAAEPFGELETQDGSANLSHAGYPGLGGQILRNTQTRPNRH